MGALASIAASRVAREFQLGGPSFTIAGEETSGLHALEVAARALQRHDIDRPSSAPSTWPVICAMYFACTAIGPSRLAANPGRSTSRPTDRSSAKAAAGLLVGASTMPCVTAIRYLPCSRASRGPPVTARIALPCERAYDDADISLDSVDLVVAHGSADAVEDARETRRVDWVL